VFVLTRDDETVVSGPSVPVAAPAVVTFAAAGGGARPTADQLDRTARALRARLAGAGIQPATVAVAGDTVVATVPRSAVDQVNALSVPGLMRLRPVRAGPFMVGSAGGDFPGVTGGDLARLRALNCTTTIRAQDRPGDVVAACDEQRAKYLLGPSVVGGSEIFDATASFDTQGAGWTITLGFTSTGQAAFADYSAHHNVTRTPNDPANSVAFLVDGRVLSAPQIQDKIDGPVSIVGNFDRTSATALANAVKSGALPLVLVVKSVR
jgi:preprotein translocase subunit SecD